MNLDTNLILTSQLDSGLLGKHTIVDGVQLPVSFEYPKPASQYTKPDTFKARIPQSNCEIITGRTYQDNSGAANKLQDLEDTENYQSGATAPPNVTQQKATASSPGSMYESDRIPVSGYLALSVVESIVQYSFNFSQDLTERQDTADSGQDWEILKIIDQKVIGRKNHYLVKWKPSWVPESELREAKELVDAFKAKSGNRKGGTKRDSSAIEQSTCQDKRAPKKRRGPRKKT